MPFIAALTSSTTKSYRKKKIIPAVAAAAIQFREGSCPGGTNMTGVSYSSLNGPYNLTQGVKYNFTGTGGDRCVVIDLGATYQNSLSTAYQNGSNYFSVWVSTDGTTWSQILSYSSVGSAGQYSRTISGTSHRYIAYTSGESGSIFNGIMITSYS